MWVLDHVDVEGPLVFEVPYGEDEVTKNDGRYVSGYALNLDYGNRSYTATGKLHLSTFNSDGKNQGNHGYSMRKEFSWNYPETIPLGKEGQATVSVQARSTKTIDDGEIEWGAGDLGVDLYFRLNEHPLNNKWDMEFDNGSENYSFKLSDQSASNSVKPSEIGLYMDAEELEGLTESADECHPLLLTERHVSEPLVHAGGYSHCVKPFPYRLLALKVRELVLYHHVLHRREFRE